MIPKSEYLFSDKIVRKKGQAASSFGSGHCGMSGKRTITSVPLPSAERMRMHPP
jgi:hypothetical protein